MSKEIPNNQMKQFMTENIRVIFTDAAGNCYRLFPSVQKCDGECLKSFQTFIQ